MVYSWLKNACKKKIVCISLIYGLKVKQYYKNTKGIKINWLVY